MTIQINSDNNITGTEGLSSFVESTIAETLKRFDEQITRVEVHLNDENSHKSGINCSYRSWRYNTRGIKRRVG